MGKGGKSGAKSGANLVRNSMNLNELRLFFNIFGNFLEKNVFFENPILSGTNELESVEKIVIPVIELPRTN